jgi:hypothetical protein
MSSLGLDYKDKELFKIITTSILTKKTQTRIKMIFDQNIEQSNLDYVILPPLQFISRTHVLRLLI